MTTRTGFCVLQPACDRTWVSVNPGRQRCPPPIQRRAFREADAGLAARRLGAAAAVRYLYRFQSDRIWLFSSDRLL